MVIKCAVWRVKWIHSWVNFPMQCYFLTGEVLFTLLFYIRKIKIMYIFSKYLRQIMENLNAVNCKIRFASVYWQLRLYFQTEKYFFLKLKCIPEGWNFLSSEQIEVKWKIMLYIWSGLSYCQNLLLEITFFLKQAWKCSLLSHVNLTDDVEWVASGTGRSCISKLSSSSSQLKN